MNKSFQLIVIGLVALSLGLFSGFFMLPHFSGPSGTTSTTTTTRTIVSDGIYVSISKSTIVSQTTLIQNSTITFTRNFTTTLTENSTTTCPFTAAYTAALLFENGTTGMTPDLLIALHQGSDPNSLIETPMNASGWAVFSYLFPGNYTWSFATPSGFVNKGASNGNFTLNCRDYTAVINTELVQNVPPY
jgi:hypothetical protein